MSELVCKTLDHDATTDVLIDKVAGAPQTTAYWDWFLLLRACASVGTRRCTPCSAAEQLARFGVRAIFVPENIFMAHR